MVAYILTRWRFLDFKGILSIIGFSLGYLQIKGFVQSYDLYILSFSGMIYLVKLSYIDFWDDLTRL